MSVGPYDEWDLERRTFTLGERERLADEFERQLIERERLIDKRERAADEREIALEQWERELEQKETATARAAGTQRPDRSAGSGRRRMAAEARIQQRRARARRALERREALTAKGAGMPYTALPSRLSEVVADTARRLLVPGDPDASIDRGVRLAHEITPGCAAATVILREGRSLATAASSDPRGTRLDTIQRMLGAGPALRVLAPDGPPWVDTGDRPAWEAFASRAERLGVAGFLSFGLTVQHGGGDRLGSLNLYGAEEAAFDEAAYDIALMVAAHLTIVVAAARERTALDQREQRMRAALSSRDVIGQAKGILMERQQLSADAAFDILRRASQRTNTRLRRVAEGIIERRPGAG